MEHDPLTHKLLVYDEEAALVRTIGEHAVAALAAGRAIVLVAGGGHLQALGEWIDLALAARERRGAGRRSGAGRVTVDADLVVRELAGSGKPLASFEAILARARRKIATRRTALHVFCDVAAGLWEIGETSAAISVESLGKRLAKENGATVLCAYPARAVATQERVDVVDGWHGTVVTTPTAPRTSSGLPGWTQSRVFPPVDHACHAARGFVRDLLESAASNDAVVDSIELICSELSANAVRHAHSVFTVEVAVAPTRVRIAVTDEAVAGGVTGDGCRAVPGGGGGAERDRAVRDRAVPDGDESLPVRTGHGLGIVAALATEWGVERGASGHAVWAEVDGRRRADGSGAGAGHRVSGVTRYGEPVRDPRASPRRSPR